VTINGKLDMLVRSLKTMTGRSVAVLVDEYGHPILSNIGEPERADDMNGVLRGFYSAFKTLMDKDQPRMLFITRLTNFFQTSVFSVLNNVDDLTLNPEFNSVCGITENELDTYFSYRIPEALEYNKSKGFVPASAAEDDLRDMIKERYDGYSRDGENRVYNPFSLVKFLNDMIFRDFWYQAGTPSAIHEFIGKRPYEYVNSETYPPTDRMLQAESVRDVHLVPLLFQAGYLTVDRRIGPESYILKGPNGEVDRAFNVDLLTYLTGNSDQVSITALTGKIRDALNGYDSKALAEGFSQILKWIPHQQQKGGESVRHAVIATALRALHFRIESEVSEAEGTFDIRILMPNGTVCVGEIKHEEFGKETDRSADDARAGLAALKRDKEEKQIEDRKRYARYLLECKEVKRLAVGIGGRTDVSVKIY
jgi:hypothetical protein